MSLTVGSLFSGIGGLDLGLERAGMRVIWQSEIDPYACRVLAKHWKDVPNHGNIKEIDWSKIERPDVICGGYPCQPFSQAGRRLGEEDPRHLFPYVLTAISELRPRYAILENVRGHLTLGGTTVIAQLASIGYDAEWTIISAASQGAPHIRERLFILAYPVGTFPDSDCFGSVFGQLDQFATEGRLDAFGDACSGGADVAYANGERLGRQRPELQTTGTTRSSENSGQSVAYPNDTGSGTPECGSDTNRSQVEQKRQDKPQCRVSGCCVDVANSDCGDSPDGRECASIQGEGGGRRDDGGGSGSDIGKVGMGSTGETSSNVSNSKSIGFQEGQLTERTSKAQPMFAVGSWWATEPDVGRVADGVSSRVDRLRGLGNAVVPQVAEFIGRLVVAHANP